MVKLKTSLLSVTLSCVILHFLWVSPSNKINLYAGRTLFSCSLKYPGWVSYAGMFYTVFMDFASEGISNSVAFFFRKMQNNLLSLKGIPFNTFYGLRNLKKM